MFQIFKMFSEFSWWFYGVVIVWMGLLEIARPGGLAGRFRSHGDRNWNSRGRSSCDSKTWSEKGTTKTFKVGDAMKPGETCFFFELENMGKLYVYVYIYISLLTGFVVNKSRFKEHASMTMFFQAQSLGEYTKFMSDSAVDKAAMFYLFF